MKEVKVSSLDVNRDLQIASSRGGSYRIRLGVSSCSPDIRTQAAVRDPWDNSHEAWRGSDAALYWWAWPRSETPCYLASILWTAASRLPLIRLARRPGQPCASHFLKWFTSRENIVFGYGVEIQGFHFCIRRLPCRPRQIRLRQACCWYGSS